MSRFWLALGMAGFLLGGLFGGWLASRFYGGQLQGLQLEQGRCSEAGKALESRLVLQNEQLDALAETSRQRAEAAERALAQARDLRKAMKMPPTDCFWSAARVKSARWFVN